MAGCPAAHQCSCWPKMRRLPLLSSWPGKRRMRALARSRCLRPNRSRGGTLRTTLWPQSRRTQEHRSSLKWVGGIGRAGGFWRIQGWLQLQLGRWSGATFLHIGRGCSPLQTLAPAPAVVRPLEQGVQGTLGEAGVPPADHEPLGQRAQLSVPPSPPPQTAPNQVCFRRQGRRVFWQLGRFRPALHGWYSAELRAARQCPGQSIQASHLRPARWTACLKPWCLPSPPSSPPLLTIKALAQLSAAAAADAAPAAPGRVPQVGRVGGGGQLLAPVPAGGGVATAGPGARAQDVPGSGVKVATTCIKRVAAEMFVGAWRAHVVEAHSFPGLQAHKQGDMRGPPHRVQAASLAQARRQAPPVAQSVSSGPAPLMRATRPVAPSDE